MNTSHTFSFSLSEEVEDFTLDYQNVFTGGILRASYRRGNVTLRSDSASTLAIVKELVSKEATARRINITDAFQVWPHSQMPYYANDPPESSDGKVLNL